jgi:hypothetical protein
MARTALYGDELENDLHDIGITPQRLRSSALIVTIMASVGRLLQENKAPGDPVKLVRALLDNEPKNVIQMAPTTPQLRRRATASLVEGLVAWQRKTDPGDTKPEPTLDFLLEVNEDPRFVPGRWRDVVADTVTHVVEGWLSRKTIDAFFRVVGSLHVERRDMWRERHKFWLGYVPFINGAWLIVGSDAIALAGREGIRFGAFGAGADKDHCGLVLLIEDLVVMEMNKVGRAIVWKNGAVPKGIFPELYDEMPYDRRAIGTYVSNRQEWARHCIGLRHLPPDGWQRKFADCIQQNTRRGVRPARY